MHAISKLNGIECMHVGWNLMIILSVNITIKF